MQTTAAKPAATRLRPLRRSARAPRSVTRTSPAFVTMVMRANTRRTPFHMPIVPT